MFEDESESIASASKMSPPDSRFWLRGIVLACRVVLFLAMLQFPEAAEPVDPEESRKELQRLQQQLERSSQRYFSPAEIVAQDFGPVPHFVAKQSADNPENWFGKAHAPFGEYSRKDVMRLTLAAAKQHGAKRMALTWYDQKHPTDDRQFTGRIICTTTSDSDAQGRIVESRLIYDMIGGRGLKD